MKDKDIFSNIPADCVAWLFVGVGVILLIGAIRRWEWVLQMQGTRPFGSLYRLGHIWGEKVSCRDDTNLCLYYSLWIRVVFFDEAII